MKNFKKFLNMKCCLHIQIWFIFSKHGKRRDVCIFKQNCVVEVWMMSLERDMRLVNQKFGIISLIFLWFDFLNYFFGYLGVLRTHFFQTFLRTFYWNRGHHPNVDIKELTFWSGPIFYNFGLYFSILPMSNSFVGIALPGQFSPL